ncbi:MAG: hypothetical protein RL274_2371 [Pseudomonadota bacterium]|jgi:DGQHR domain-containing protein
MTKKNPVLKEYKYQALFFAQREDAHAPSFVLFHAPASELIEWAEVDRLAPKNRKGAQRPLKELKVNKVAKFLKEYNANTIPTAVVVALDKDAIVFDGKRDPNKGGKHGVLTIKERLGSAPGLIIDGQHRAFGTAAAYPSMHLCIVAFIGGDDAERAFQFIVINNSASRVTKNHVQALNLQYDDETLNQRLLQSAGVALALKGNKYDDFSIVDAQEPFKGLLDWPTNPKGFIAPNAVESALNETRDRAVLLGIEDLELDFLLDVWSRIKHLRKAAWHESTKNSTSHLLEKVSIYALTVYILDSIGAVLRMAEKPIDFTDLETLHQFVDRAVTRIPEEFWTSTWKIKELDTSSGRQILLEALASIDANVRFERPWYEGIAIVDAPNLKGQYEASKPKAKKATKKKKN